LQSLAHDAQNRRIVVHRQHPSPPILSHLGGLRKFAALFKL
jgi:hypothetical protein